MSHWLSLNVWPVALHTFVSGITAAVVATAIVAPVRGALRRMRGRMSAVLDSLDPDVPIGLTRQLDEMEKQLTGMHEHLQGTLKVEVKDAPLVPQHRK